MSHIWKFVQNFKVSYLLVSLHASWWLPLNTRSVAMFHWTPDLHPSDLLICLWWLYYFLFVNLLGLWIRYRVLHILFDWLQVFCWKIDNCKFKFRNRFIMTRIKPRMHDSNILDSTYIKKHDLRKHDYETDLITKYVLCGSRREDEMCRWDEDGPSNGAQHPALQMTVHRSSWLGRRKAVAKKMSSRA